MIAHGFVPVIDGLVEDMGSLPRAYLYGYIWLNRDKDNCFDQPLETVARRISLSRTTVLRHIKKLCDDLYLHDLTPDEKTKPHCYQCTGKVNLRVTIHISTKTVSQNGHPRGIRETPQGYQRDTPGGIRETPMHDIMMHEDRSIILKHWTDMGFDVSTLEKLVEKHTGNLPAFERLLSAWVAAFDTLPESWGYGLIYNKISAGELPPAPKEPKKWYAGDEALFAVI